MEVKIAIHEHIKNGGKMADTEGKFHFTHPTSATEKYRMFANLRAKIF